nr:hypothetical protein Iba_chr07dCG6150 [Ipomoea batatas]
MVIGIFEHLHHQRFLIRTRFHLPLNFIHRNHHTPFFISPFHLDINNDNNLGFPEMQQEPGGDNGGVDHLLQVLRVRKQIEKLHIGFLEKENAAFGKAVQQHSLSPPEHAKLEALHDLGLRRHCLSRKKVEDLDVRVWGVCRHVVRCLAPPEYAAAVATWSTSKVEAATALALSYVAENREGREREDRSHCSPEERTREVGRAHGIQMTSSGSRYRRQNRVSSPEIVAAAKRHPLPGRRGEKSPLPMSQLPSSRIAVGGHTLLAGWLRLAVHTDAAASLLKEESDAGNREDSLV